MNYFVKAALISAKLDRANKVARELLLTASNARAVALRAGQSAAGFKPLTDFIDQLAKMTIKSSTNINTLAATLCRTSVSRMRVQTALDHFDKTYALARESENLPSIELVYGEIKQNSTLYSNNYYAQKTLLQTELDLLNQELRTAIVLATMSRVEASQANEKFHDTLFNVADNVESSANRIRQYISEAQGLADELI